jgi:hypothetical protein
MIINIEAQTNIIIFGNKVNDCLSVKSEVDMNYLDYNLHKLDAVLNSALSKEGSEIRTIR